MAAVKYAPPAMPPRKKYQTISIPQSGVLSIAASIPARPEREQRTKTHDHGRADRQQRGDDAERARRHAVAAPVADVLVDVDGPEFRPVDRAGRTRVETAGVRAVLADVGHEQPRHLALRLRLLDEADQPERLVGEVRVV